MNDREGREVLAGSRDERPRAKANGGSGQQIDDGERVLSDLTFVTAAHPDAIVVRRPEPHGLGPAIIGSVEGQGEAGLAIPELAGREALLGRGLEGSCLDATQLTEPLFDRGAVRGPGGLSPDQFPLAVLPPQLEADIASSHLDALDRVVCGGEDAQLPVAVERLLEALERWRSDAHHGALRDAGHHLPRMTWARCADTKGELGPLFPLVRAALGPRGEGQRDASNRRVESQAFERRGRLPEEALRPKIADRSEHLVHQRPAGHHVGGGAQPPSAVHPLEACLGIARREVRRADVRGAEVGEELLAAEVLDVVGERLEEVVAHDVRARGIVDHRVHTLTARVIPTDRDGVRLVRHGEHQGRPWRVETEAGAVLGVIPESSRRASSHSTAESKASTASTSTGPSTGSSMAQVPTSNVSMSSSSLWSRTITRWTSASPAPCVSSRRCTRARTKRSTTWPVRPSSSPVESEPSSTKMMYPSMIAAMPPSTRVVLRCKGEPPENQLRRFHQTAMPRKMAAKGIRTTVRKAMKPTSSSVRLRGTAFMRRGGMAMRACRWVSQPSMALATS